MKLKISATDAWTFVKNETWPDVVKFVKGAKPVHDAYGNLINKEEDIESTTPSWLKASVTSGGKGETVVEFTAESVNGGRELELVIIAGDGQKQYLRVRQGTLLAQSATCKEIIDGPDGKTYRVKGTCTTIENTTYGNWWLDDGTGSVLVYGTLDAGGKPKNFASLNIEVGDVVEVEGPKVTFGSKVELKDVMVLGVTKSLIKVVTEPVEMPLEGGTLDVKVAYKGNGVFPSVAEQCREWLTVADMKYVKGIPTKIMPNPADTAIVTLNVAK
ncbi:nucleic acid-binding domain protein, partial [gut metagenome]